MYIGHTLLSVRLSMCLFVCLSAAAFPHYCKDPDVIWGMVGGCPLVVHYWPMAGYAIGARVSFLWQHSPNAKR